MYLCQHYENGMINSCRRNVKTEPCRLFGDADLCPSIELDPMVGLGKAIIICEQEIAEEEKKEMIAGQQFLRDRWEEKNANQ